MTDRSDQQLQEWMNVWSAPTDAPAGSTDAIVRYVQRRSRMLRVALVGEAAAVIAVAPLLIRGFMVGDAVERVAMSMLTAIVLAALGFSWWNWRGAIRASAESTAAFLELSRMRVERLERAIVSGWILLAAEVTVFVPWIAYRLYRGETAPEPRLEIFSWGLLVVMSVLGASVLVGLARWAHRERTQLDAISLECGDA